MPYLRNFCTAYIIKYSLYYTKFHDNPLFLQGLKQQEITALSSRNHLEKLRKSRQLLEEITATSCGNHLEKLRKS